MITHRTHLDNGGYTRFRTTTEPEDHGLALLRVKYVETRTLIVRDDWHRIAEDLWHGINVNWRVADLLVHSQYNRTLTRIDP